MTRPVSIHKHTLARAAQVARKEGVAIVVEADGVRFTILPDVPAIHSEGGESRVDAGKEFSLC